MTLVPEAYDPKRKSILFVIGEDTSPKEPILPENLLHEVMASKLYGAYNILFANDFLRPKEHRTERGPEFQTKHNIYRKRMGDLFFLCVGEGTMLDKRGRPVAFDMTFYTKGAKYADLKVDLIVAFRQVPVERLMAFRENAIPITDILKGLSQYTGKGLGGKTGTRLISYENFGKVGRLSAISRILEGTVPLEPSKDYLHDYKENLDELQKHLRQRGVAI